MLTAIVFVVFAGAVGGFVNGLGADRQFIFPQKVTSANNVAVWRLGIAGSTLVGSVTALVLWSIYGGIKIDPMNFPSDSRLPITTVDFSVLVGMAGSNYITSAFDNIALKRSAALAMNDDPVARQRVIDASAMEILNIAASRGTTDKRSL